MSRSRTSSPVQDFWSYFDLGDELWQPSYVDEAGTAPLRLEDFSKRSIAEARRAATACSLPWPPHLPSAEEYALDHRAELA